MMVHFRREIAFDQTWEQYIARGNAGTDGGRAQIQGPHRSNRSDDHAGSDQ